MRAWEQDGQALRHAKERIRLLLVLGGLRGGLVGLLGCLRLQGPLREPWPQASAIGPQLRHCLLAWPVVQVSGLKQTSTTRRGTYFTEGLRAVRKILSDSALSPAFTPHRHLL